MEVQPARSAGSSNRNQTLFILDISILMARASARSPATGGCWMPLPPNSRGFKSVSNGPGQSRKGDAQKLKLARRLYAPGTARFILVLTDYCHRSLQNQPL